MTLFSFFYRRRMNVFIDFFFLLVQVVIGLFFEGGTPKRFTVIGFWLFLYFFRFLCWFWLLYSFGLLYFLDWLIYFLCWQHFLCSLISFLWNIFSLLLSWSWSWSRTRTRPPLCVFFSGSVRRLTLVILRGRPWWWTRRTWGRIRRRIGRIGGWVGAWRWSLTRLRSIIYKVWSLIFPIWSNYTLFLLSFIYHSFIFHNALLLFPNECIRVFFL